MTGISRRLLLGTAAGLTVAPLTRPPSTPTSTRISGETVTGTLDRIRSLKVRSYGHSFLSWDSDRSYINRLASEFDWDLVNGAVGGDGSVDMAARVIGNGSQHRWTPGAAHLVLIDAATNDMFGSGLAGLEGYRNAIRAACVYPSTEGPMDSQHVTYPGGQWWTENGGDWHGGSAKLGGPRILLPGFGRSGKWAFGHGGIPGSLGEGARFDILADDIKVGELDCDQSCLQSPKGRTRGHTATIVDVDATTQFTLQRQPTSTGGGPWFDWYAKLNEVNPPLILLPKPVYSPFAAYQGTQCTDAVVDAYGEALAQVAAEVGPHCVVVDTLAGWDRDLMMLPNDQMHPSPRGHAHIAAAIRQKLIDHTAVTDWWPHD